MTACQTCGRPSDGRHAVIHHFLCAYVGPHYDYAVTETSIACPKCGLELKPDGEDNEVVGYCCKCPDCGREYGWGA